MRWRFRRTPAPATGTILHDATLDHRCRPPGCHEWPAGEWFVDDTARYPEGTIWRCDCGAAWRSGRYPPRFSGRSYSLGMWLNWYRDYDNDAEETDD